jgi:polyisoprenoid-binding protein YceI
VNTNKVTAAPAASNKEFTVSTIAAPAVIPAGTWIPDPAHTRVGFAVKHLGIATVRGTFATFEGTLITGPDLASSSVTGTIDPASIDTAEAQRDEHLRSADFFDVTVYPEITFASTAITPTAEDEFTIVGDLTMHGVTRSVSLKASVEGLETDPWGQERVGLEVTGQLSRGDFGMKFNQALGSGNMLVSDTVKLSLDISAIRQAS